MIDTEKTNLVKTMSFCLPIKWSGRAVDLILEKGAHTQSYNTPTTSFHDDPEQRLIVLSTPCRRLLFFPVGTLLKFLEASRGSEIAWDLWRENAATPSDLELDELSDVWVSGCRLFAATQGHNDTQPAMWVYDFSVEGRERCLGSEPDPELGGVRSLRCTGKKSRSQHGDWMYGTHDSIMFTPDVSATSLSKRAK